MEVRREGGDNTKCYGALYSVGGVGGGGLGHHYVTVYFIFKIKHEFIHSF